jgi:hypothetical protein
VGKKYQNNKADTSQPAVPEQVSVALGELVGEVGEGCWPWLWAPGCRC